MTFFFFDRFAFFYYLHSTLLMGSGGELPDSFLIDPDKARKRLGLIDDDVEQAVSSEKIVSRTPIKCAPRTGIGSRYPGKHFKITFIVQFLLSL